MLRPIFLLSILALPMGWAQKPVEEKKAKHDALASLPVGATLTRFSHPRFDQSNKPLSLLTADRMIITSKEKFTGEELILRLFNSEKKVHAVANMKEACFWINKEQVEAYHHLFLRSTDDQFLAEGKGGILDLETQQGFLFAPARTLFTLPEKKRVSMKLTAPLLLATLPLLSAAPPPEITSEQIAEFEKAFEHQPIPEGVSAQDLGNFERTVAPRPIPTQNFSQTLAEAQKNEAGLTSRLTHFLQSLGQAHLLSQVKAPTTTQPVKAEKDLFTPGQDRLVINTDRGIYFDGANHEFAYLGNIKLATGGMTMTCTNGLRAMLKPAPKKEGEEKKEAFAALGDLKQFTASGSIVLKGINEDGKPVAARADRALYNAENNEIILRGKKMFYRHGDYAASSTDPKATVRIKLIDGKTLKDGHFDGNWKIGLTLKKPRKK